jgi:hypothetical protein
MMTETYLGPAVRKAVGEPRRNAAAFWNAHQAGSPPCRAENLSDRRGQGDPFSQKGAPFARDFKLTEMALMQGDVVAVVGQAHRAKDGKGLELRAGKLGLMLTNSNTANNSLDGPVGEAARAASDPTASRAKAKVDVLK